MPSAAPSSSCVGLLRGRPTLLRSAPAYGLLVLGGAVLAIAAMERALITRDFTVLFVAENGSSRTPALFNVATLWSALEGSILLWALVLAGLPGRRRSASSGTASTTRWWAGRWSRCSSSRPSSSP